MKKLLAIPILLAASALLWSANPSAGNFVTHVSRNGTIRQLLLTQSQCERHLTSHESDTVTTATEVESFDPADCN